MAALALTTVPQHRWPSGLAQSLALIGETPAQLSARLPISFTRELDDLGPFDNTYLLLPSGLVFALRRYLHDPEFGTAILIDDKADPAACLAEIANAISVETGSLRWRADGS
jgi:hypothetical protein